MKKLFIITTILLASFAAQETKAQVSVRVNIGQQPKWGPRGYNHVDYYYMPDIDAYYCISSRLYTFMSNGRWISSRFLPPAYRNYDLYHGNYIVINEPRPWLRHSYYMSRYNHNDRRDERRDMHYNDRRDDHHYNDNRREEHYHERGDRHDRNDRRDGRRD